jgi:hypothetical protein
VVITGKTSTPEFGLRYYTDAMRPPAAAYGATWQIDRPEVPPENRPSVISAQAGRGRCPSGSWSGTASPACRVRRAGPRTG